MVSMGVEIGEGKTFHKGQAKKMKRVAGICVLLSVVWMVVSGCGDGKSGAQWKREGMVRFQAGDYGSAAEAYRNAVVQDPEDAVAWNLLGMAYRFHFNETGDPHIRLKEIDAFQRAVRINPRMLIALKNLTASLYYSGDRSGAAVTARKVLKLNPEDPEKALLNRWIREAQAIPEVN